MEADKMILGDGPDCVFTTDSSVTGVNNNTIVVGSSGAGKTKSILEAMLLELMNRSAIGTFTKRRLVDKYSAVMRARKYEVLDLDFVHPGRGNVGYDPLDFICSYQDIAFVARGVVTANPRKEGSHAERYWDDAAVSLLSAVICYVLMTKDDASFDDVLNMIEHMSFWEEDGHIRTNYDRDFEALETKDASNFAVTNWKSFHELPMRTGGCVFGTLNTAINAVFNPEVRKMFRMERKVDFEKLASRKTVLFLTSSPVNPSVNCFINLFYSHAFKQLFEFGEEQRSGHLPVSVLVIADDFATGCPVPLFDEYISVFREVGISVTLLIQSESQLSSLYGPNAATTVINNCDNYVYMGSNDLRTAQSISLKVSRPLEEVLYLPVGSQILFRRGQKPIWSKRYNITENKLYQKITREYERDLAGEKDQTEGGGAA